MGKNTPERRDYIMDNLVVDEARMSDQTSDLFGDDPAAEATAATRSRTAARRGARPRAPATARCATRTARCSG